MYVVPLGDNYFQELTDHVCARAALQSRVSPRAVTRTVFGVQTMIVTGLCRLPGSVSCVLHGRAHSIAAASWPRKAGKGAVGTSQEGAAFAVLVSEPVNIHCVVFVPICPTAVTSQSVPGACCSKYIGTTCRFVVESVHCRLLRDERISRVRFCPLRVVGESAWMPNTTF